MFKRHKHIFQYMIEDNTIFDKINFTRSLFEMTHVWHLSLGHMSSIYLTFVDDISLLSYMG